MKNIPDFALFVRKNFVPAVDSKNILFLNLLSTQSAK